jgi:serine/threonine protein kinase
MADRPSWQQIEELFHAALELDPADRAAFLDQRCNGDADLRSEVESLLHSSDRTTDFLSKPILNVVKEVATGSRRPLAFGDQLGRYTVISEIGSGGMGCVYLARDSRLKRRVALKVLSPELTRDDHALRRFEHEALAASSLNHPNILTIFEFGESDGYHFIVSEMVEGPTLRQKLSEGPLGLQVALDVASQITNALGAAHAHGIVHRDIKPENIILRPDGLVKVLDFGIAKLIERQGADLPDRGNATQAGMVIGTLRYMSPEQARGMAVDGRSDIFSLGSLLYEMVAGRAAFQGTTGSDVLAEILKSEPPPLETLVPGVPSDVHDMVFRALRKDPRERYQTAEDCSRELLAFKKELEFHARQQKMSTSIDDSTPSGDSSPRRAIPSDRGLGTSRGLPTGTFFSPRFRRIAAVSLLLAIGGVYSVLRKIPANYSGAPRSLAILPFRNLKPDPETDFLGFSLADAIITKLGYVSALSLRPSSAVDKYRNHAVDPQRVATELRVDTLLMGSFVKDGDDLRITSQLIDAKADKILWQDTIDLKYDKLLTVQDRVSQEIIKGLELSLSPTEAEHLRSEGTIAAQAYEYYLRGVDFYSLNDFGAAVRMLEKSTEIEPNYASTWAHLGRAYSTSASLHFGGSALYEKARQAEERALTLDPSLVEPRVYMGNLLTDTGQVEEAIPLLRGALRTNPNNAEAHWELGYAYRFGGMLPESIAEAERARGFDPAVKINSSALNGYLYLGQYEKFLQSLPTNNSAYILFYRAFAHYHEKKFQLATEEFDTAYNLDPTLLPAQVGKALSFAIARQNRKGLDSLRETEDRIDASGAKDPELMYKVAQAYAVLADKPSALRMLQRSIEGGFFCYPYFERDPLLDNLRDQPTFDQQLHEALQRHQRFEEKFF